MADAGGGREVRIEGPTLWAIALALVAALSGVFWLGRLYERASAPQRPVASADPLRNLAAARDVPRTDDLSFFDTLSGPGQQAEPARQASAPPAPASREGAWFVQVFAGRDRRAAELVVKALGDRGHPVKLETERDGGGSLFKVRVGGFATRESAESAATVLRGEGQGGAWVVRAGG